VEPTYPPTLGAQEALSVWVKRPERASDHLPQTCVEIKGEPLYTDFITWALTTFTFTCTFTILCWKRGGIFKEITTKLPGKFLPKYRLNVFKLPIRVLSNAKRTKSLGSRHSFSRHKKQCIRDSDPFNYEKKLVWQVPMSACACIQNLQRCRQGWQAALLGPIFLLKSSYMPIYWRLNIVPSYPSLYFNSEHRLLTTLLRIMLNNITLQLLHPVL